MCYGGENQGSILAYLCLASIWIWIGHFYGIFDFELDTSIFWLSPTSPPPPPPKIIFCLLHCLFVKCGHFCINCRYWCKIVDVSVCKRILSHVWILMIICVTWFSVGLASIFFFNFLIYLFVYRCLKSLSYFLLQLYFNQLSIKK